MKALFWNIRGMGKPSRVRLLKDLISQEQFELVGVQETIKQHFFLQELEALTPGINFKWNWVPAKGHSGGILLGVRGDILEVENWVTGNFFVEAQVRHRSSNLRWSFLTVYGPANHELSEIFLMELKQRCCQITFPLVVGVILT